MIVEPHQFTHLIELFCNPPKATLYIICGHHSYEHCYTYPIMKFKDIRIITKIPTHVVLNFIPVNKQYLCVSIPLVYIMKCAVFSNLISAVMVPTNSVFKEVLTISMQLTWTTSPKKDSICSDWSIYESLTWYRICSAKITSSIATENLLKIGEAYSFKTVNCFKWMKWSWPSELAE